MFNYHYQQLDNINHHNDDDADDYDMNVLASWSELNQDLLGVIMCKFSIFDQACFHTVCRTWHATHPTTTMSLPWFVTIKTCYDDPMSETTVHYLFSKSYDDQKSAQRNIMLEFKTYDPVCYIHPKPLSIFTLSLTLFFGNLLEIKPVKNGWFFICCSEGNHKCHRDTRLHLVLFSLPSKKVITLPFLDYPFDYKFVFSFSTYPESPDCVFIILGDMMSITTHRNGDNGWKYRKIDMSIYGYMHYVSNPVYVNGYFYIVAFAELLLSYNTIDGELKYESLSPYSSFQKLWFFNDRNRVFMLDGELMVLCLIPSTYHNLALAPSGIQKFDWINKVWVPVSSLGDHTLFVRDDTHWIATVRKEAARNYNEASSNKLYYFQGSECHVYSLENGEFVQVKWISVNLWNREDVTTDPPVNSLGSDGDVTLFSQFMYNMVIRGDDAYGKSFFWLDPPVIKLEVTMHMASHSSG